jgi:hypothetical protein
MTEKNIYTRAKPANVHLREHYYYEKIVSKNPLTRQEQTPTGKIEVNVPYDGYQYFSRESYFDVKKQLGNDVQSNNLDASIGYLVLTDYGRTNLKDVLDLSEHYGAIPLRVPILGQGITNINQLYSDQFVCDITIDYVPKWPEIIPMGIDLQLWDEDTLSLPDPEVPIEEMEVQLASVATQIAQQVNFRRNLLIKSRVRVDLPRSLSLDKCEPKVSRMSIGWPTITSFRGLSLGIGTIPTDDGVRVTYNPQTRSLEWLDIPMNAIVKSPGADVKTFVTDWMYLLTDYPGELYQQPSLEGQAEVELQGHLLSGIQVRLFNGVGEQSGNPEPKISSFITTNFKLILDEAFAKRILSPYQHLYFDEVIPEEMRIADIKTALADRGFRIVQDKPLPTRNEMKHFILAERPEGPETMELWVFIEGKRYEAERETQVVGGQTYRSTFESGEIKVYIRGEMPGNSHRLTQEMNAFQTALRDRFERLRARR